MAWCAFEKNKTCVLQRMDARKQNGVDKSVKMEQRDGRETSE